MTIACQTVKADWKKLGVFLNINKSTVQAIDVNCGADVFDKLTDLISKWIRREKESHRPSWRVLCEALEDMGERGLAETIAQKHPSSHNGNACSGKL